MKTHGVVVKAVIVRNQKVLTMKRSSKENVFKNLWDIPGGCLTRGESFSAGLSREAKEEIGVGVKIQKPWRVWDFTSDKDNEVVGITFICSLARANVKIKLSEEHTEYQWATLREVSKLPMNKNLRNEIVSYMKSC